MSTLLTPDCPGYGQNTAVPDCVVDPKHIIGAILIHKSKSFSAADMADLVGALVTNCLLDSKILRGYPVFRFVELKDNSQEPVVASLGYGNGKPVRDGKYDWTFKVLAGGLGRHIKLRSLNKTNRKVLLIDEDNNIYGVKGGTQAAPTLTGFALDYFQALPWKLGDGSNPAVFEVRMALERTKEFNELLGVYPSTSDVEDNVKGVMDVILTAGTVTATSVKVTAKTELEGIDMYDLYVDALAVTGAWSIVKADGTVVTVSTAAKDTAIRGWTLGFSSIPATTIDVSMKGPATLDGLSVGGGAGAYGFESDTLTVTTP